MSIVSFQKHAYVRSKKLMEAYRKIPCMHCGVDDGTVCGAHSNWGMGKGMGIKASHEFCASLCHQCHMALDQGRLTTKAQRQQAWWLAHCRTVRELTERGLWPKGIEVPDTSVYPFDVGEAA